LSAERLQEADLLHVHDGAAEPGRQHVLGADLLCRELPPDEQLDGSNSGRSATHQLLAYAYALDVRLGLQAGDGGGEERSGAAKVSRGEFLFRDAERFESLCSPSLTWHRILLRDKSSGTRDVVGCEEIGCASPERQRRCTTG
jgi:hypothetical protein